jgi:hypothetical protein
VTFEVQDTWGGADLPAAPGPAFVAPAGGAPTSFSFTWVLPGYPAAPHILTLVWKQDAASGTSTLLGGDVVITYHGGTCASAG